MNLLEHENFDGTDIESCFAQLSELKLHYIDAGPKDGPMAVLLHGFPEFWFSWRRQIQGLVAEGFRVICPDMRGYNLSDKPPKVRDYKVENIANDIVELVRHLGREEAFVAGHDWGAMIAWQVKMDAPKLAKKLVIMNVPHPIKMSKGIWKPAQLRKSWYVFAFQLPNAESMFSKNNYKRLRVLFRKDPRRKDAFSEEEIEAYVQAMSQPGAGTAAVNYYRCAARRLFGYKPKKIEDHVLVIWGEQDLALGKNLSKPPRSWVPENDVVYIPEASHWVQSDAWEKVNALLIERWSD